MSGFGGEVPGSSAHLASSAEGRELNPVISADRQAPPQINIMTRREENHNRVY